MLAACKAKWERLGTPDAGETPTDVGRPSSYPKSEQPCRIAVRNALLGQTSDLDMIDFIQTLPKPAHVEPVETGPPMLQPDWLFGGAINTLAECDLVEKAKGLIQLPTQNIKPGMPSYAVHLAFLMYHARHNADTPESDSFEPDDEYSGLGDPVFNLPIGRRFKRSLDDSRAATATPVIQEKVKTFIQGMNERTHSYSPTFLFESTYKNTDQWEYVVEVAIKILLTQDETKIDTLGATKKSTVDNIVDDAYDTVLFDFTQNVNDPANLDSQDEDYRNATHQFIEVARKGGIPRLTYKNAKGDSAAYDVKPSHVTKSNLTGPLKRWYRSFVYQRYYGRYMAKALEDATNAHLRSWEFVLPDKDAGRVDLQPHITKTTDVNMDVVGWVDKMPAVLRLWVGTEVQPTDMIAKCRENDKSSTEELENIINKKQMELGRKTEGLLADMECKPGQGSRLVWYNPALFSADEASGTTMDIPNARKMLRRIGDVFSVNADSSTPRRHREMHLNELHPKHRNRIPYLQFCQQRHYDIERPLRSARTPPPSAPPSSAPAPPSAPSSSAPAPPSAGLPTSRTTTADNNNARVDEWITKMAECTRDFNECFRAYTLRHDIGRMGECVQEEVSAVELRLQSLIFRHIGVDMGSGDGCRVPISVNAVLLNMLDPSTCLQATGALVTILCHSYSTALHAGPGGTVWFAESWRTKLDFLLYLLLQHLHADSVGKGPPATAHHDLSAASMCLTQPRNARDILTLHQQAHRPDDSTCYEDLVEALSDSERDCRRVLLPNRCLRWLRVLGSDTSGEGKETHTIDTSAGHYTLTECLQELWNIPLQDRAQVYTWPTILRPRIKHEKHIVEHIVCVVLVLAGVDLLPTGITFSGIYPPDPVKAEAKVALAKDAVKAKAEEAEAAAKEAKAAAEEAKAEEAKAEAEAEEKAKAEKKAEADVVRAAEAQETAKKAETAAAAADATAAAKETAEKAKMDAAKATEKAEHDVKLLFSMYNLWTSNTRMGGLGGMISAGLSMFVSNPGQAAYVGGIRDPAMVRSIEDVTELRESVDPTHTSHPETRAMTAGAGSSSSAYHRIGTMMQAAARSEPNYLTRIMLAGMVFLSYLGLPDDTVPAPQAPQAGVVVVSPDPTSHTHMTHHTPQTSTAGIWKWFHSGSNPTGQPSVSQQAQLFQYCVMVLAICGDEGTGAHNRRSTPAQKHTVCYRGDLERSFQALQPGHKGTTGGDQRNFGPLGQTILLANSSTPGAETQQRLQTGAFDVNADTKYGVDNLLKKWFRQQTIPALQPLVSMLLTFRDNGAGMRQPSLTVDAVMELLPGSNREHVEQVVNSAHLLDVRKRAAEAGDTAHGPQTPLRVYQSGWCSIIGCGDMTEKQKAHNRWWEERQQVTEQADDKLWVDEAARLRHAWKPSG